jgi:uncharacterized protein (DUF1330 family)
MKAYFLFDNIQVNDLSKLELYKSQVVPTVEKYGGRYTVLGGQFTVVEGNWKPTYLVMLEFPSYQLAQEWYASEDYRELKSLRLSAVETNGVIIEGL